jgi:predicted MFS family arabinose efflux permease
MTLEIEATAAPPLRPALFPWAPILLLGFMWLLAVAIELSPAGVLNAVADDFGVSIAAAGTLTTFYALGNALLVLPLTALALRFARRPTIAVVAATLVASTAAVAIAPTLALADAARFIGGAAYAVVCTLFPAIVVRIAGPGNAGKALAVVFTATSLGVAFGAPITSLVGHAVGWRPTFAGAAALMALAAAMVLRAVPGTRAARHDSLGIIATLRLPGVFKVAFGWSLTMLAHFVVLTYIDAYLRNLGAPAYLTSLALSVIGVGGIVGSALIGAVSSRSLFAGLLAAPVVTAAGFVTVYLAGPRLPVLLTGIALWGIGVSAAVVVYQHGLLLVGARAPETATSIGVVLAQAGFAAGATVGGTTIATVGIHALPLAALLFAAASAIIATTLAPTVRHRPQPA